MEIISLRILKEFIFPHWVAYKTNGETISCSIEILQIISFEFFYNTNSSIWPASFITFCLVGPYKLLLRIRTYEFRAHITFVVTMTVNLLSSKPTMNKQK